MDQITELDNSGQLESYSDIGILALGCGNSWVLGWKGWVWSEGIDPTLLAALRVDEGVTVTVSSPHRGRRVGARMLTDRWREERMSVSRPDGLLVGGVQ